MTTNCNQWLSELRSKARRVLSEDLAALSRMSDRKRVEIYNEIKTNEETLRWDFQDECPDIRTPGEIDAIISRLRLARLLIAASFYKDAELPVAMQGDFADGALEAAVDFERYKQFDVLSEDQINKRIRRMDGEVYELVTEYTNTQLSNMDELIDNPKVQKDVVDELTTRYDDRLENVRQGFYTYVEQRGLEGMVDAVENAIKSVSESQQSRAEIESELREELDQLSKQLEEGFQRQQQTVDQRFNSVQRELAQSDPDLKAIRSKLENIDIEGSQAAYQQTAAELKEAISETRNLEQDLNTKIDELEEAKQASADEDGSVSDEVSAIVAEELSALEQQREKLRGEIGQLQQERSQIEAARDRLDQRQQQLSDRVEEIESSVGDGKGGIEGESVVTPTIARLLELDYIGRFETSMYEIASIRLADDTFDVPDDYWGDRSERRSERPKLAKLLEEEQDIDRFPENQSARFEIMDSRYLGLSQQTQMIIEATVVAGLESLATNEFNASPADLEDLLTHVNRTVHEAETEDVTYLLGIASPTGWDENVEQQIANEGIARTRFSRHVSVVLVDLQDGSIVYDNSDPVAKENKSLFELPVNDERIESCMEVINDQLAQVGLSGDAVMMNEIVQQGYDHHVVKRAFDQYSNRGGYSQQYVDEQLVLFED